ncbi:CPBP family intramembrane glutamic endopeptidase [Pseudonocardia xishanensis]|uniref:CPBP family intramembrane metalloprotease n=1 Tax=Pseudonocardia xishanensis TaxID=630995 RepID=A0ABP8RLU6_9PSEU
MTASAETRTVAAGRVDLRAVAVFLTVTFGASWLIASPLWFSGRGLATPGATLLLGAMMVSPSLGVLAVRLTVQRGRRLTEGTGLGGTGFRRWWRWGLLGWLAPLPLALLALGLATAVGVYHPDLAHLSGLTAALGPLPVSPWVLVAAQLAQVLVVGWVDVIPALGEEWGWRGWLLPELLPWGEWPAMVVIGVVWGLWHAPVLLLGYNYPLEGPAVRLLLMVAFCVVLSVLFGWLRLRSESVWPAAIAHGFLNAAAGSALLFSTAGQPVDNATTGLLGWTGWLVLAAAFLGVTAVVRHAR